MFWFFKRSNPNKIFSNISKDYFPRGRLLVPWQISNRPRPDNLLVDNIPISDMEYYVVKKDYYWAMGDNRDDSLDSRYWGFIPRDYILGEALFSWFSINLDTGFPRFKRIGNVIH
jgi:signal peptidase I